MAYPCEGATMWQLRLERENVTDAAWLACVACRCCYVNKRGDCSIWGAGKYVFTFSISSRFSVVTCVRKKYWNRYFIGNVKKKVLKLRKKHFQLLTVNWLFLHILGFVIKQEETRNSRFYSWQSIFRLSFLQRKSESTRENKEIENIHA